MADIAIGDTVRVVNTDRLHPFVANDIQDKTGVVLDDKDASADYVVRIEGTQREGGRFALNQEEVEIVRD